MKYECPEITLPEWSLRDDVASADCMLMIFAYLGVDNYFFILKQEYIQRLGSFDIRYSLFNIHYSKKQ